MRITARNDSLRCGVGLLRTCTCSCKKYKSRVQTFQSRVPEMDSKLERQSTRSMCGMCRGRTQEIPEKSPKLGCLQKLLRLSQDWDETHHKNLLAHAKLPTQLPP